MYTPKTVLHLGFNQPGDHERVVPLIIYISPGSDLEWFNTSAPDDELAFFQQIVEHLQGDEWPAIQAKIQTLKEGVTSKKVDAVLARSHEIVLDRIKFVYEVRQTARAYSVLLAQPETKFATCPMESFEFVVWMSPKDCILGRGDGTN
ncbi:Aste57867_11425 [Aphanomyces stellatus]|uniref:Aste57867_11425 protein n=1 Tax=Aphanomyces stellatus TaxID=120398 RepID=A0A485KT11_9STRA|nr:hypothetical protein As57867_011383 [Aphanomyces stellatus]VFT88286.1 Aste57867_11425 [Aphanomyces stellatus]